MGSPSAPIGIPPDADSFIHHNELPALVQGAQFGADSQRVQEALLNCRDNAPKFSGDGFGYRVELRISDMFHGDCGVDGSYLDLAASKILHDHVTRQHRSDLVIGSQRLMRQWRIARTEYSIILEINVQLLLYRGSDINLSQNAKSLRFE